MTSWSWSVKVWSFEEGWNVIENGITKIKNMLEGMPGEEFDAEQYQLLYHTVYEMSHAHSHRSRLYDGYKEMLVEYLKAKVIPALREKQGEGESFVEELGYRWNNHKTMVRLLCNTFNYLDRQMMFRGVLPMRDVGLKYFRDLVNNEIEVNVKEVVIVLINGEREGKQVNRALVKNILEALAEIWLGQANEYAFETLILAHVGLFLREKVPSWIQEDSNYVRYVTRVDECLKREKEWVSHYLQDASSLEKVLDMVDMVREELLNREDFVELVEKEYSKCHILLRDYKVEDLSKLYSVLCRTPKGLKYVEAIFRQHVINEGTALIDHVASNKKVEKDVVVGIQEQAFIIEMLSEFLNKHLRYVTDCFANHFRLHITLCESFGVFCGKGVAQSTSGEFFASSCHNLLKKEANKRLSDEVIEDILEKVVKLLAYIYDKDLFVECFEKKLARRVLLDNCANDNRERSFMTKLKQQYGACFTSKMEGMMSDLVLAREKQLHFEEYLQGNNMISNGSIDFAVLAVKSTLWPNYMTSDVVLPPEMVKCIDAFMEFYQTTTNDRKLTWIYSLGTCSIIGRFEDKPIELIMTTYQAIVLLLFNDADKLSYNEIKNKVNLSDDYVIRLLHSLSCANYEILNKVPDTKVVEQDDTFAFNAKFTHKLRRIKVPLLQATIEIKKARKVGEKDKHYSIDAAIVRIMKRHKQLPLEELVEECGKHFGWNEKPSLKVIKNHVEDLIASEYMERDKKNPTVFNYLA